jgi:hypothetical protein
MMLGQRKSPSIGVPWMVVGLRVVGTLLQSIYRYRIANDADGRFGIFVGKMTTGENWYVQNSREVMSSRTQHRLVPGLHALNMQLNRAPHY